MSSFMGHLLALTHPWAEEFSDGVTGLSAKAVSVLLGATSLAVSPLSWVTGGAS